ncbi:protein of unknown function (plasmid) [Pararobbsia alpina]
MPYEVPLIRRGFRAFGRTFQELDIPGPFYLIPRWVFAHGTVIGFNATVDRNKVVNSPRRTRSTAVNPCWATVPGTRIERVNCPDSGH